jgi:hypothetical protein
MFVKIGEFPAWSPLIDTFRTESLKLTDCNMILERFKCIKSMVNNGKHNAKKVLF